MNLLQNKKLVIFLIIFILGGIFTLVDNITGRTGKSVNSQLETSENIFADYSIEEKDIINEMTKEKIGKRGYIKTNIENIEDINLKDLKKFYTENIEGKKYNYFNIFLKGENHLTFVGGMDITIEYGPVDEDGAISQAQIGQFVITDDEENPYTYNKY